MDFLESMFSFFDSSASVFAALVPIAAIAFSYWQAAKDRHGEICKTRYMSLIAPLFDLAEPYMLRTGKCKALNVAEIQVVLHKEKHLCGGDLRKYIYSDFSSKKDQDAFCKLINKEYDQTSKTLGIPRRSQRYRLQNYWPRFCVFQFVVYIAAHAILFFVILLTMVFFMHLAIHSIGSRETLDIVSLVLSLIALAFAIRSRK